MGIITHIIKQLLRHDNKLISYYQLYQKLRSWENNRVFPFENNLPKGINFPTDFWTQIITLFKKTRTDNHERSVTLFWADGELVITPTTIGTESSVTPYAKIKITYKPTHNREYYFKYVIVNGKTYKKEKVYYKKIPNKIELHRLFNLHTHPPHPRNERDTNQSGSTIAGDYRNRFSYSFWSRQDIVSFLTSKAIITGLITDRLLLLIRTKQTPSKLPKTLQENLITPNVLTKKLHIGVYQGEFKKTCKKYLIPTTDNNTYLK